MSRTPKDGTYLNVKIEKAIYDRLEEFRKKSGQTKTAIVERSLTAYMDTYEKLLTKLNEN